MSNYKTNTMNAERAESAGIYDTRLAASSESLSEVNNLQANSNVFRLQYRDTANATENLQAAGTVPYLSLVAASDSSQPCLNNDIEGKIADTASASVEYRNSTKTVTNMDSNEILLDAKRTVITTETSISGVTATIRSQNGISKDFVNRTITRTGDFKVGASAQSSGPDSTAIPTDPSVESKAVPSSATPVTDGRKPDSDTESDEHL